MDSLIADIGYSDHIYVMMFRVFVAATLSGLIGLEREIKNQPAGLRTHLLVGIGSSVMMMLSVFGFSDYIYEDSNVRFDPARIPSYVISGIGFLGAGTIIVRGAAVKGLTTAASIWVVAGIGLLAGNGMYDISMVTTVTVLISLWVLNMFENKMLRSKSARTLQVTVYLEKNVLSTLLSQLDKKAIKVRHIDVDKPSNKKNLVRYTLSIDKPNQETRIELIEELTEQEYVESIHYMG
ncbi:MgtC/SapB family protein [Bacillus marinisedimentorum]|uniref:MgtC/SapB family protein n=1 Tax=Bacillus marinisedimentorum TaxID=1821260 RepID=UPI000872478D|nr:MgtC/SapB family protein [Bacillus marinisedimentorum]